MNMLNIDLEEFEGPMDILLYLIKKDKIDIYDIPIAKITAQYLQYLEVLKEEKLDLAGDFFVMAATLIRIKTQMLLPVNEEDERDNIEDPREELVIQLLEYKKFKDLAEEFFKVYKIREQHHFRQYFPEMEDFADESVLEINLNKFYQIYKKVAEQIITAEPYEIEFEELSLEEKMEELLLQLKNENHLRFFDLINVLSPTNLVITFIAILELAKLQRLRIIQNEIYEEIWLEKI